MATPRIAAGALFFDDENRVLLVKPTYKAGWDIPGGYVEPGESPHAALVREIKEEIGLTKESTNILAVDWAPTDREGDKILFVFDGGMLTKEEISQIHFKDGEIAECQFVSATDLGRYLPPRLIRRVSTSIQAKQKGVPVYAENGRTL
nr:NUDIX hydrolase [Actinoplanes derwentensis]